MSKKAEEAALRAYPVQMVSGPIGHEEPKFDINAFGRYIFAEGFEQAEKDIIALIESRLSELLSDAQPTPILRYELRDLIKKIKE